MPDPLKFVLNISCDGFTNDAIPEVIRILREVADRMEKGDDASFFRTIHDMNGFDVGRFKLSRRI